MNSEALISSFMLFFVGLIHYFKDDSLCMYASIVFAIILFLWSFIIGSPQRCPKCKSCLTNNNIWKLHHYSRCRCSDCDTLIGDSF